MSHIFISIASFDKNEFDKQLNYLLGLGCELKEGSYSEDTMSFNKKYYSQTVLIDTNKYSQFEYYDEEGKRILLNNFNGNYYKKTTFYNNGQIASCTLFNDNAPVGKSVGYYENGQISGEINYSTLTQGRSCSCNGIVVLGYDGLVAEYFENGQIKSEKHYYYDGVTSKSVGTWIDWYKNGQIKKEAYYHKGCRNGKWIEYYENGQTKSIEFYYTPYDPLVYKVGNWTYYNKDGTVKEVKEMRQDLSDHYDF
jgi:antitoxin component YwqK of YwqJK toxin-antitoxin module